MLADKEELANKVASSFVVAVLAFPWPPSPILLLEAMPADGVPAEAAELAAALAAVTPALLMELARQVSSGTLAGEGLGRALALLAAINGLSSTKHPAGWASVFEHLVQGMGNYLKSADSSANLFTPIRPDVLGALAALLARRPQDQVGGAAILAVLAALATSLRISSSHGGGQEEGRMVWRGCMVLGLALARTGILPLLEQHSAARMEVAGGTALVVGLLAEEVVSGDRTRAYEALDLIGTLAAFMPRGSVQDDIEYARVHAALQAAGEAVASSQYATGLLASMRRAGSASGATGQDLVELAEHLHGLLETLADFYSHRVTGPIFTALVQDLVQSTAVGSCGMTRSLAKLWGESRAFVRAHRAALHLLLAYYRSASSQLDEENRQQLDCIVLWFTTDMLDKLSERVATDWGEEEEEVVVVGRAAPDDEDDEDGQQDSGDEGDGECGYYLRSIHDVLEMASVPMTSTTRELKLSMKSRLERGGLDRRLCRVLSIHRQGATLVHVLSLVAHLGEQRAVLQCLREIVRHDGSVTVADAMELDAMWQRLELEEVDAALTLLEQLPLSNERAARIRGVIERAGAGGAAPVVHAGGDEGEGQGMDMSA